MPLLLSKGQVVRIVTFSFGKPHREDANPHDLELGVALNIKIWSQALAAANRYNLLPVPSLIPSPVVQYYPTSWSFPKNPVGCMTQHLGSQCSPHRQEFPS